MRLSELVADTDRLLGDPKVRVTALTADSRAVVPGALFAALRGANVDGLDFAEAALAAGAAAILGDDRLAETSLGVPRVIADDPRRALALMAARFHAPQPRHAVAVTGTNGKTSTASFTVQLWRAVGRRSASLGTLGLDAPGFAAGASLTTPDPVALHATLQSLAASEIDHLVVEASSHGLDQRRLDGLVLEAAAFLNLTRDHLDYHGSEAAYLAAKWRLFDTLLPPGARAILHTGLPRFDALRTEAAARGLDIVDIGPDAGRFRVLEQRPAASGQHLRVSLDGREHDVFLGVVGAFQATNLLAALALAEAAGATIDELVGAVGTLQGPRGRMEHVASHPSGASVFVDYAHTPDALKQALTGLRPHTRGRLVVVFGCGGDRDPGKRPQMGAAAARFADIAIVTDDNPRSEDPATIRKAALVGAPGAIDGGDRATAIAHGLDLLRADDVLLVAGKGHETGQEIAGVVHPFDDALVVRRLLAASGAAA